MLNMLIVYQASQKYHFAARSYYSALPFGKTEKQNKTKKLFYTLTTFPGFHPALVVIA